MIKKNRIKRVAVWLAIWMGMLSLPRLAMAHPGHGLEGLVVEAFLLALPGCPDAGTGDTQ